MANYGTWSIDMWLIIRYRLYWFPVSSVTSAIQLKIGIYENSFEAWEGFVERIPSWSHIFFQQYHVFISCQNNTQPKEKIIEGNIDRNYQKHKILLLYFSIAHVVSCDKIFFLTGHSLSWIGTQCYKSTIYLLRISEISYLINRIVNNIEKKNLDPSSMNSRS